MTVENWNVDQWNKDTVKQIHREKMTILNKEQIEGGNRHDKFKIDLPKVFSCEKCYHIETEF